MEPRFDIPRSLIERAITGDAAAENALFEKLREITVTLTNIIGRSKNITRPDDLEDIAQNVLFSLFIKKERLLQVDNWQAWMWRIISNHCVDHIRRAASKQDAASLDAPAKDGEETPYLDFLACAPDGPAKVLQMDVEEFLDTLVKEKAEIFRLYLRGYAYEEIAETFRMKINTVGVEIYRIKKQLARYLGITR